MYLGTRDRRVGPDPGFAAGLRCEQRLGEELGVDGGFALELGDRFRCKRRFDRGLDFGERLAGGDDGRVDVRFVDDRRHRIDAHRFSVEQLHPGLVGLELGQFVREIDVLFLIEPQRR